MVALSRVQSGVGLLSIQAATSELVGDLRLGCAYQLRDGHSSTVQHDGGFSAAPRDSRNPVIAGRRDEYERIQLDLRHSREIDRLIVYAFSSSGAQLQWGGTLVTSTFGGARIELPLDRPASGGVAVLLSVFNVRGEFVLRAEMEIIAGTIRDACKAYGFDRITWLDDRTPVD